MIKQFKEIDTFFKNDRFSDKELMDLKNSISFNYKDLNAVKLAYSIIELQILKFEMIINEMPIPKTPIKSVEKNKKKPAKKTNKIKNKKFVGNEVINANERVENSKNTNLIGILSQITETESKEYILNKLREKGIYKGRINIKLSPEDYNYIKHQIKSKINTNKERDPSLRIKTSKTIQTSKSNTVYDKLKTFKGIGKIIYIRSK